MLKLCKLIKSRDCDQIERLLSSQDNAVLVKCFAFIIAGF